MRVLLTSTAYGRHWPLLAPLGAEPVVLGPDGAPRTGDATDIEVAWATSDLATVGAPLRAFVGRVMRSRSIKWFQSPAAGYDDPLLRHLAKRGVAVTNAHVNAPAVAEFVVRAVLDHFQGTSRWRTAQEAGTWEPHDFREMSGTTWAIVGMGAIGSELARRVRPFGATVIGCRRQVESDGVADRTITLATLPSVLGQVDVVVLCVPATLETELLVDDGFLRAMKPGSVLVNVARGRLVDEAALVAALDRGTPEVAILDVFGREPLPQDHPFWGHPAVRVTPHNAGSGSGRYEREAHLFAANLAHYVAGRPLANDVTEAVLRAEHPGGARREARA